MASAITDLHLPGSDPQARFAQRLVALQEEINNVRSRVATGGGTAGPAGPTGPTGPAGTNGADGLPRVVQDEGVDLPVRDKLNFIGAGVAAADDSANNRTNVTITATGSGGGVSDAPVIANLTGATSYTFAGLDGDLDEMYEIVINGIASDGGAIRHPGLRFNAVATGYGANEHYHGETDIHGVVTRGVTTRFQIGTVSGTNVSFVSRAVVYAKSGRQRICQAFGADVASGVGVVGRAFVTRQTTDTTNNITSLVLDFGGATFTGTVMLRKMLAPSTVINGPRIVRGRVNADGSIAAGSGFTVTKTGVGDYTITFATSFAQAPVTVATGVDPGVSALTGLATATTVRIRTADINVAYQDCAFTFIAIDTSGAGVASYAAPQRVDTLPSSAVDQQEIYFRPDPTGNPGVIWHLRRDAVAAKWDFLGGSPLIVNDAGAVATTSTTSVQIGTVAFTVPSAGEYQVEVTVNGDTSGTENLTVAPGGTGITVSKGSSVWIRDTNTETHTAPFNVVAAAAGNVIQLRGQVSAGNVRTLYRGFRITPIRVG